MKSRLHRLDAVPEGKVVGDILPVFSDIKGDLHVGEPNRDCASCRKPFTQTRKPRKSIRLYPYSALVPMAFQYRVCGACYAVYQRGGDDREGFLAAVEAYHDGGSLEAVQ
jgi:hypothetical protein